MPVVRNPQFYFKEGFCWTDVSYDIKCRKKGISVNDVLSMALYSQFSQTSEKYLVCIINARLMSDIVCNFINNTSHFQINDARQIPIIIPTNSQLKIFEALFDRAYSIQQDKFANHISETEAKAKLESMQKELDTLVYELYRLKIGKKKA
ncbi:DNA modification methylase [Helicobacter sp. MIT 05-5293]|uniref:DNA modification methylase n=1 Tax=Helicobacter sp. MIT 05-5293 TaxID=1548149 RepID=UPI000ABDC2BA|nr:DNA modification methylase [Helicobacter sp. MIT 05-5293]TLD82260.1 DNA modification methylase [Helicobacter sp. MIT 05-5293]